MERPYLVYVGGDDQQEIECLYLGTDGETAQALFDEAAQDGANSIVRFCHFPEHSQIRTPARDGVPVKETEADEELAEGSGPSKPKESRAKAAPSASTPEGNGDDDENGGI